MLGQSVGQSTYMNDWNSLWLQGKSGVVRRTLTPSFQGSNPCSPARMRVFLEKGELFFCLKYQRFSDFPVKAVECMFSSFSSKFFPFY